MPDTLQQQRPTPSFNTTFQPASVLDQPGVTKPNGGVARAIAFARGLSGKAVVLAVVVFGFQALMPQGSKPSDLIGSFHGATESAEMKAKQAQALEFERRMADAKAAPPANWQIEQMTAQAQLQERAKSLGAQEEAAQVADLACLGSALVTPFFGDTRDAREWRDTLKQGCAAGNAIRDNINNTLARGVREGSGVVPRSNPATGAGSAPSLASPALSR